MRGKGEGRLPEVLTRFVGLNLEGDVMSVARAA